MSKGGDAKGRISNDAEVMGNIVGSGAGSFLEIEGMRARLLPAVIEEVKAALNNRRATGWGGVALEACIEGGESAVEAAWARWVEAEEGGGGGGGGGAGSDVEMRGVRGSKDKEDCDNNLRGALETAWCFPEEYYSDKAAFVLLCAAVENLMPGMALSCRKLVAKVMSSRGGGAVAIKGHP